MKVTKQSHIKLSANFRQIQLLILFGLIIYAGSGKSQNQSFIEARPVTQIPVAVYESSGIAVESPNRIWSHNDAGNTNELFCIDTTGNLVRTLLILNASNIDWEDLTKDDQGRLYINDAGNNGNNRTDLRICRIPNPETIVGSITEAEIINFIYEDQYLFPPPDPNLNYDVEAIIWKSDSLYLFTKNRSNPQNGICKMYRLPAEPGTYTAQLMGSVFLGNSNNEARVTSADINLETGEVVLLTTTKIVSFTNYPFNNFFDGEMNEYFFSSAMGQIEGVAFVDSSRLFLTEEGTKKSGGYLYEVLWQTSNSISGPKLEGIAVFPNPFTNNLIIQKDFPGVVNVDIWDVKGTMMMKGFRTDSTITLQHLDPGVYFIKLSFGEKSVVKSIVKQ